LIIFCWFNDNSALRAFESDDDAYRTFERMIGRGNPPDDWDRLLALSAVSSRERKG
jgi:toxin YhaV